MYWDLIQLILAKGSQEKVAELNKFVSEHTNQGILKNIKIKNKLAIKVRICSN